MKKTVPIGASLVVAGVAALVWWISSWFGGSGSGLGLFGGGSGGETVVEKPVPTGSENKGDPKGESKTPPPQARLAGVVVGSTTVDVNIYVVGDAFEMDAKPMTVDAIRARVEIVTTMFPGKKVIVTAHPVEASSRMKGLADLRIALRALVDKGKIDYRSPGETGI